MTLRRLTTMLILAAGLAGGCANERYRTQPLGQVPYNDAFQAGREAMARHFQIASASPDDGTIIGRPKPADAAKDRLLGSTPARKVAELRIRQKGQEVYADVRVDVQRQDVPAMRAFQPVTVDNERPTQGPSQETAMLTPDQDTAWATTGRDEATEREIIADIVRRFAPAKE